MTPLTVLNLRATVITQWLGALGFHTATGIPISWDTSRGMPRAVAHASRDEVLDAANRTIPTAETLEWELGGQRLPWQTPVRRGFQWLDPPRPRGAHPLTVLIRVANDAKKAGIGCENLVAECGPGRLLPATGLAIDPKRLISPLHPAARTSKSWIDPIAELFAVRALERWQWAPHPFRTFSKNAAGQARQRKRVVWDDAGKQQPAKESAVIPIVEWSVRCTGEVELWDPAMRRTNAWGGIKSIPNMRDQARFCWAAWPDEAADDPWSWLHSWWDNIQDATFWPQRDRDIPSGLAWGAVYHTRPVPDATRAVTGEPLTAPPPADEQRLMRHSLARRLVDDQTLALDSAHQVLRRAGVVGGGRFDDNALEKVWELTREVDAFT